MRCPQYLWFQNRKLPWESKLWSCNRVPWVLAFYLDRWLAESWTKREVSKIRAPFSPWLSSFTQWATSSSSFFLASVKIPMKFEWYVVEKERANLWWIRIALTAVRKKKNACGRKPRTNWSEKSRMWNKFQSGKRSKIFTPESWGMKLR